MLYFAYGSNMNWKQMRERCPSAKFLCVAKLNDHRLAFTRYSCDRKCGVADIISAKGSDVWGVVYDIEEVEMGWLDRTEGYDPGRKREDNCYVRKEHRVYRDDTEDSPLSTHVYFAIRQDSPPPPNEEYKKLIVDGAKFWHLPDEYIRRLESIEVGP